MAALLACVTFWIVLRHPNGLFAWLALVGLLTLWALAVRMKRYGGEVAGQNPAQEHPVLGRVELINGGWVGAVKSGPHEITVVGHGPAEGPTDEQVAVATALGDAWPDVVETLTTALPHVLTDTPAVIRVEEIGLSGLVIDAPSVLGEAISATVRLLCVPRWVGAREAAFEVFWDRIDRRATLARWEE
jgi:hypothetical protein